MRLSERAELVLLSSLDWVLVVECSAKKSLINSCWWRVAPRQHHHRPRRNLAELQLLAALCVEHQELAIFCGRDPLPDCLLPGAWLHT